MKISYLDKSSNKKNPAKDLVILPTDTDKLKIIIIPLSILPKADANNQTQDILLDVQNILKNCEVSKQKTQEVWLPSFKTLGHGVNQQLSGLTLGEDTHIQEAHQVFQIETSKGRYQNEGLKFDEKSQNNHIIDYPFIFGN